MQWLKLQEERISLKLTWLLITMAYAFSVGFRLFLSNYTSIEGLKKSGEFLNTPDGYFFAKGALDLLNPGKEHTWASPDTSLLARLTAFLTHVLPINFETLVFFMPAFVASLIVIPLVLIGHSIRQTTMGFIAALMGSVAHSYYIRSQTGYYDTDMLSVVLPMLLTYFVIGGVISRQKFYLPLITITAVISQLWYPQAYSLNTALFAGIIIYTLVFDRKNLFNYQAAFFLLFCLAGGYQVNLPTFSFIIGFSPFTKMVLAICLYVFFNYWPRFTDRIFWYLFSATFVLFAATGGVDPLISQLRQYLVRGDEVVSSSLQFYNVISTIREAQPVSFLYMAERVSGHVLLFALACLGYCLSLLAYRPLLFTLPMAGLGFLALFGGLRFTIYAAPVMALGLGYFILLITKKFRSSLLRYSVILVASCLALYMNYLSVLTVKFPKVLNDKEIAALDHLALFTKPNDYIVSWWDFGHSLRYYANAHAFIDGNKHDGFVNFPVAFALTDGNLTAAAHMLRIAVEHDYFTRTHGNTPGYIENYMTLNKISDPNQFLEAIADKNYPLPPESRNVFLVLPYRMVDLVNAMQLFSNIDLATGKERHPYFFLATRQPKESKEILQLAEQVSVDKKNWIATIGGTKLKITQFIVTQYEKDRLLVIKKDLHPQGDLSLIYMKDYGTIILTDNRIANSAFIKLFVLEETDPRYFEPFIITPFMKIFKLKV